MSEATGTILAGWDGSTGGRDALALADLLARESGADVASIHAWRSPVAALRQAAQAVDADLLVLGSSRHGPRGRVFPGGVATRLLHHPPCPIALAPAGYSGHVTDRLRVVMAAFNGSPESRAALEAAGDWALRAGATVRLVGVSELGGAGAAAPDFPAATNGEYAPRRLRDELEDARAALPTELRADARLLDEAELGVDLAVIGSRGFGAVMRALLGSVSGAVARQAPCPVLVVPYAGERLETRSAARA
jgi:nucleotide-binding universal stress UspA family protein